MAQQLAAAHPDRIRALQLPENSGGCGAPRNHGVQHAAGSYVMFLDSDDVLEPNACRNMLEAAERTGADLVSGMCVRVNVDSRNQKQTEWYPWIYSRTRTIESISELPDLLVFDTLSTNKCYRREFLLESGLVFPVGIHYEDLLFSAQAYVAAKRITLIPNHVYFWNVFEKAATKSISNRRHEIANFAHRMEIHRRVDELLEREGLAELKFHKDVKFLKHDLVLHLRDLPLLDEDYRREFAAMANGYLAGISPEAYERVQPIQAICAYLLAQEDWHNLMPAVDTLINRDKLSSPLAERDGRIYWCAEHLDDPEGRRVLDVTDAGYHTRSVGKLFLRNQLTSYEDDGRGTVRLAGTVVNPLGKVTPGTPLRGRLELKARRKSLQAFSFPLTSLRIADDGLHWDAELDLARRLRPLGVIDAVWDVRLILDVDGVTTRTRLTVGGVDLDSAHALRVRPRLTRLVSDRVEPATSKRGHLTFVLDAQGKAAKRTNQVLRQALRSPAADLAKSSVRKARKAKRDLNSGETKLRVYNEVFSKLPVHKGLVVFESHLGKQYSDSPRAIYEEMRRQGVDFEAVWAYDGKKPDGFPKDATLVKRWSWPYLRALAQAEFWIDNQGFPLRLNKRPETTYIQTWHGSALKRMGFDEPRMKLKTRAAKEEFQKVLDRFDHFLVRSEHDVRTLARAFRLRDEVLLRSGYPRNDALVAARVAEETSGVRERGPLAEELGIGADKTVLLYAPTFRANPNGSVRGFFGRPSTWTSSPSASATASCCSMRSHYLNNVVLPPSVRGKVIDVTGQHDITPLLQLADAMITDYSSVMFDYALLDRPMLFFAYDYDEYANEARGTYFDLKEKAPGPVLGTAEELFEAIENLKAADDGHREARRRFTAEFGEYDQGDAARMIVERFFGGAPAGADRGTVRGGALPGPTVITGSAPSGASVKGEAR
ncbi:Bifunctional glycosyltransferase family 2 protein/CDP-glycerol:glycerophosphate glycerophosphotransferase OS=Streptomyces rimosus subsp. rimosus (strain ATCC / DSM 40260 / JCM 4667 / NRRL 2234) OX=1265868 GN=SRIM_015640 PE=3 SV=1 [Streptomyces rimosus subsp. rimosus]